MWTSTCRTLAASPCPHWDRVRGMAVCAGETVSVLFKIKIARVRSNRTKPFAGSDCVPEQDQFLFDDLLVSKDSVN